MAGHDQWMVTGPHREIPDKDCPGISRRGLVLPVTLPTPLPVARRATLRSAHARILVRGAEESCPDVLSHGGGC